MDEARTCTSSSTVDLLFPSKYSPATSIAVPSRRNPQAFPPLPRPARRAPSPMGRCRMKPRSRKPRVEEVGAVHPIPQGRRGVCVRGADGRGARRGVPTPRRALLLETRAVRSLEAATRTRKKAWSLQARQAPANLAPHALTPAARGARRPGLYSRAPE